MFESGPNYSKLKTNLRLAVNRLKLLEKKNTELALKARKEIADYIAAGKAERAKIRVEQIIREDYLVEAMELLEMYCDLLLARFGLIQQMKTLDEGLAEAISSLIWVAPRMQADVQELKVIAEQLGVKYGKPYSLACRDNAIGTVSPKLMHKLSVQAPPKILVEKYIIEIAKNYNVPYEPDPQVMREEAAANEALLIDFTAMEAAKAASVGGGEASCTAGWIPPGAGAAGGPGWAGPAFQPYPSIPHPAGAYGYGPMDAPPPPYGGFTTLPPNYQPQDTKPAAPPVSPVPPSAQQKSPEKPPAASFNIPPNNLSNSSNNSFPSSTETSPAGGSKPSNVNNLQANLNQQPKPSPRTKLNNPAPDLDLPDLPSVPDDDNMGGPGGNAEDDIDFDDLTRRFEELKKRK
uniref:IST1 homolog n=1 Tax=Alona affinis TaxID=381656 RepID=A0A9N6ZG44_9CRUS|nr:EOG090X0DNH [Alona affinis]